MNQIDKIMALADDDERICCAFERGVSSLDYVIFRHKELRAAIEQALKPGEVVARISEFQSDVICTVECLPHTGPMLQVGDMLYSSPPQPQQWVGLTDEETSAEAMNEEQAHGFIQGAMWAEAKLREKNGGKP